MGRAAKAQVIWRAARPIEVLVSDTEPPQGSRP